MNRHLARAFGATALGTLLMQPVTTMADPPAHARNHRDYDPHYDDRHGWASHYCSPRRGHVVVDPPVGLVVSFPPQFSTLLYVGDVPYYRAGPVYCVWHPRARGYVVTDRPYARW